MQKSSKKLLAAIARERRRKQDLRGLSHQPMTRQRGFKGGKLGAASPCKRIDPKTGEVIEVLK